MGVNKQDFKQKHVKKSQRKLRFLKKLETDNL